MHPSIRKQLFAAIAIAGPLAFIVAAVLATYGNQLERAARPMDRTSGILRSLDRIEMEVDDLLTKGDLAIGSDLVYLKATAARSAEMLDEDLVNLGPKTLNPEQRSDVARARRAAHQIENLLKRDSPNPPVGDPPLERFDIAAGQLVSAVEALHASTVRELEALDAALEASRRRLDGGGVVLIILYIALLAGVWRWSSRRIVEPLRNLERNAANSLSKNESFTAIEGGGAEVVSLSRTVQALVGSLEERVTLRTTALERQTADLESEVAMRRRTERELALALKAAHAALHARTEFLAQMSHELRTPLGAILGYAEMLGGNDLNQADRPSIYEALIRNGSYLLGLINDLLRLTEVESEGQTLNIVELNPRKLATEVIETVAIEAEANRNNLELRITDDVADTIFTDDRRVKQILVNLLGNALKFTTSGTVELCLSWSGESEHPLDISVRDSGAGILPGDLEKVFDAFFQANPTSPRGLHGVGLGLAISKNLAVALGADLTVESSIGVGTTFHLRLPRNAPEGSAKRNQAGPFATMKSTATRPPRRSPGTR